MRFLNPMIVVSSMEKSKAFYRDVLNLEVTVDFGANVTLTGGIALQTKDTWKSFIGKGEAEIIFGGNVMELYFEEDDFDSFMEKVSNIEGIKYVHGMKEHSWGQRVIRFYDPDNHIIEVGENMNMVINRFLKSGLTIEETAKRMDVSVDYINSSL